MSENCRYFQEPFGVCLSPHSERIVCEIGEQCPWCDGKDHAESLESIRKEIENALVVALRRIRDLERAMGSQQERIEYEVEFPVLEVVEW